MQAVHTYTSLYLHIQLIPVIAAVPLHPVVRTPSRSCASSSLQARLYVGRNCKCNSASRVRTAAIIPSPPIDALKINVIFRNVSELERWFEKIDKSSSMIFRPQRKLRRLSCNSKYDVLWGFEAGIVGVLLVSVKTSRHFCKMWHCSDGGWAPKARSRSLTIDGNQS